LFVFLFFFFFFPGGIGGSKLQINVENVQASQKGLIGITLVSNWFVPVSEAKHHKNAALRALDYMFGW
jgi:beta-glucosidase